MSADLTRHITDFALGTSLSDVPETALRVFRLSLLDWYAVGSAGCHEPVANGMRRLALDEAGRQEASVFGSSRRVPARMAAFVNGATSHALDYDDTHFAHVGHPSVTVIPAALAVAERIGADRSTFDLAALLGLEASCRLGVWLGRDHYLHGFHMTATAGAFGACLAAARLLRLSSDQTGHAIGLASTRASGLKSLFGTMGKPLNAGIAAANGVEAALLASMGVEATPKALTGAQGFGPTHKGMGDSQAALDGLGETCLFEAVQHKFHACCHGTHAALEAIAAIKRGTPDLDLAESARSIHVRVNPRWLSVCDIAEPTTGLEAKFSYRLTVAMALSGISTASLETFSADLCRDPALITLRDRVTVSGDPEISDTGAHVMIDINGTSVDSHHDLADPISLHERERNVRTKARALLGPEAEARSWSAITDAMSAAKPAGLDLFA